MPDITGQQLPLRTPVVRLVARPPPPPSFGLNARCERERSDCKGNTFLIQHHQRGTAPCKHLNCKPFPQSIEAWHLRAPDRNGAVHPPQCCNLLCLLLQQYLARFQLEYSHHAQQHKTICHEE